MSDIPAYRELSHWQDLKMSRRRAKTGGRRVFRRGQGQTVLCLIEGIPSLDKSNSVARDATDQLYRNFRVLLLFIQIGR